MLSDDRLRDIADDLVSVPGVVGVMLGGSRARGAALPDSDVDLGLYYRPPLGVSDLRRLARTLGEGRRPGEPAELTVPGAWGPWVDGGGWLSIDGAAVDWIYRDLDRVNRSWQSARAGVYAFHFQVGHPLGVPDFAYAGEVALGVVLADPHGELTALQEQARVYPAELARAVVAGLAEAEFLLDLLPKSASRGDVALVAGCLFRVVELCAHALHGKAGRWVINEKGLVQAAGKLPDAPEAFAERAQLLIGQLGTEPASLRSAVEEARVLLIDTVLACE